MSRRLGRLAGFAMGYLAVVLLERIAWALAEDQVAREAAAADVDEARPRCACSHCRGAA